MRLPPILIYALYPPPMTTQSQAPNAQPLNQALSLPESKAWTETERAHALAVFAETNSVTEAERQTGIPKTTIHQWTQSERGIFAIEQLRTMLRARVAWQHIKTLNKALNLLHKRLDLGDEVVLPNGQIVYKAVSARDLMMIAAVSQDKHATAVGQIDTGRNVDNQLGLLAKRLMDKLAQEQAHNNQGVKPVSPNTDVSANYLG